MKRLFICSEHRFAVVDDLRRLGIIMKHKDYIHRITVLSDYRDTDRMQGIEIGSARIVFPHGPMRWRDAEEIRDHAKCRGFDEIATLGEAVKWLNT